MIKIIFSDQQEFRQRTKIETSEERIEKLDKIIKWILSNRNKIKTAIHRDFNKAHEETDLTEIYPVISEIKHSRKNIRKWMKSNRVKKTLSLISHSGYIKYEPKGIVLIIAPWNYPFQLAIGPLISAIAAGNSVIIKPSEISKNTSQLIADMISEIFEPESVAVIQGDKNVVTELLACPFDHIFFTGSTQVGKIIAKAGAESLASVTVELGGKSPVIVDESVNLNTTAEKIIWGKFLNKGQTCIAPDYVLVDKKMRERFVTQLIFYIQKLYTANATKIEFNKDYAKIINENHHNRLLEMIEDATLNGSKILYGGNYNKENKFIEPTILLSNCENCKINESEIFGPILPIVEYDNLRNAIEWMKERTPPLAIYIFSKNKKVIDDIASSTKSGSIVVNDVMIQFSHHNLPFGGVKESGIGRSHGYAGFKSFSNERSYLVSSPFNLLKTIYPPFNERKKKIIDFLIKHI